MFNMATIVDNTIYIINSHYAGVHISIPYLFYKWKSVPFDSLHPSHPPINPASYNH